MYPMKKYIAFINNRIDHDYQDSMDSFATNPWVKSDHDVSPISNLPSYLVSNDIGIREVHLSHDGYVTLRFVSHFDPFHDVQWVHIILLDNLYP